MGTKRQELQKELAIKEDQLTRAIEAKNCNCDCHRGWTIDHERGCCSGNSDNIPNLEQEILELKIKLKRTNILR